MRKKIFIAMALVLLSVTLVFTPKVSAEDATIKYDSKENFYTITYDGHNFIFESNKYNRYIKNRVSADNTISTSKLKQVFEEVSADRMYEKLETMESLPSIWTWLDGFQDVTSMPYTNTGRGVKYNISDFWKAKLNKLYNVTEDIIDDMESGESLITIDEDELNPLPFNSVGAGVQVTNDQDVSNVQASYDAILTDIETILSYYNNNVSLLENGRTLVGKDNDSDSAKQTSSAASKCKDGWWGCAWDFLDLGGKTGNNGLAGTVDTALQDIKDLIFDIGNIIFIVVTAYLGVKYIWGSVESKFSVKNSLVTLVVAAMVFYGWNAIEGALNIQGILTGSESSVDHMGLAMTIYNTIMYIINVAAVAGIIYIGIKYMMAGADGKAEMKLKFIPVIMGIIMVYGTLNLIKFILNITVGSL